MKNLLRISAQTEKGRPGRIHINLSTLVVFKEQNWKGIRGKMFLTLSYIPHVVWLEKKEHSKHFGDLIYRHSWQQPVIQGSGCHNFVSRGILSSSSPIYFTNKTSCCRQTLGSGTLTLPPASSPKEHSLEAMTWAKSKLREGGSTSVWSVQTLIRLEVSGRFKN